MPQVAETKRPGAFFVDADEKGPAARDLPRILEESRRIGIPYRLIPYPIARSAWASV